ncbi:MAG TPA: addiction module protein [Thermoanaerobaculia bacterium]|jgi:putative addiction module component (TIGR02574 family)
MTRLVEKLYEQAAELPEADRAELAGLLLESIEEPADDGVEEAWAAEIERRMADYRAGKVKTIAWAEVRAHLHRADR